MSYPSDITREQFAEIAPILGQARKKTKPRQLDMYEVFNALLYVNSTGCQWRAVPKDYPKWRSVYRYFHVWKERPKESSESVLDKALKKIGRTGAYERWQKSLHEHGYC